MSDEFFDEDDNFIVVNYTARTTMMRFFNKEMIASPMKIDAVLNPMPETAQEDIARIMAKFKFFFSGLVNNSIAFTFDNKDALSVLIGENGKNKTSNMLMITPYDPSDELLATLFQAKLTALGMGLIEVESCSVSSKDSQGLSYTFVGRGSDMMPDMISWIGERSYFKEPWWDRNDASLLDIVPPAEADLTDKPAWAYSLDTVLAPKPAAGIVVRPDFKPKVLDGGKS